MINWKCPYCSYHSAFEEDGYSEGTAVVNEFDHQLRAKSNFITCHNMDCKKYSLTVELSKHFEHTGKSVGRTELMQVWRLIPFSNAKVLPDYIPKAIVDDYNEAHAIASLSPKASATLARRCLQGMIRDFYGVSERTLADEIAAIKDKIDTDTWAVIDATRKIGNIGAHMEKDINLIVDVEEDEALLLLELIENLIDDWYVSRNDRQLRNNKILASANQKQLQKSTASSNA